MDLAPLGTLAAAARARPASGVGRRASGVGQYDQF